MGHGTRGLPHFQEAGWGRGASPLLTRSKAEWRLAVSQPAVKHLALGSYYFPLMGAFICVLWAAS